MSGRQRRRSVGLFLDVIVALLLGFTLAVPPAAWVASRELPVSVAGAPADLSVAAKAAPVQLRTLPAFDSGGVILRAFPGGRGIGDPRLLRSAIESQARSLGVDGMLPSIWQVLDDPDIPPETAGHPLRFGALDDLLDDVVTPEFARTHEVELNDLAVLFVYDAAYTDASWAGRVAYSLMNRIRAVSDRCEPQLNLAFLLTLEPFPDDDQVLTEFRRAERACGSDLTPLWYLGQFQIRRSYIQVLTNSRSDLSREEVNARPVRTFRDLQQRQPTSPLGWVGEAEAWLRVAEAANGFGVTPFTARQQFRRADDLLIRAGALSDDPAVRVGRARALIGQGRAGEAADLMTAVLRENPSSLRIQVLTVEMLERAHRFAEALEVADRPPSMPNGFSLAMDEVDGLPPESYLTYQLFDAVPVMISIATTGGFGGGGLDDYGFIPQVRQSAESTVDGLCRVASTVRDLITVGRPADALAMADGGADDDELVPGRSCIGASGLVPRASTDEADPPQTLAAIAALELEDEAALARWTTTDGAPATDHMLSDLMDARQNLWRFAGDLPRAARAAQRWSELLPADPMPHDRLGEIAFLSGDYATAAAEFQQALEGFAVRSQNETIEDIYGVELSSSLAYQARALLKLGAARHLSGDDTAATASLTRASDLGTRGLAQAEEKLPWQRIVIDAQRQIGDISLLRGDDAAALAHYLLAEQALIERNAEEAANRDGEFANFVDNGALQNNMSLAYARDGDHRRAIELGEQALQRDRSNPVFVETLAFAQQSAGDAAGAIAGYEAALTEDPTLFTAQNNRGVLLAQAGRFPEAVQAFRAAIGANHEYATAWRNLGVVIPQAEGLTGWLASLGALGRANIIERDFRGVAPELTFDTTVYATQLDLSKPLGPDWSFATSVDRQTLPLTIFMIMALAARMLAALVADQLGSQLGGVLVQPRATVLRRLRFARLRLPAAWAVALTVALAALTGGNTSAQPQLELILVAVGTLALIGLYLRSRSWFASRLGGATHHVAWSPAMIVGIAGAFLNFAFPPLPVAELPARTPAEQKARLVGPITLAVVGATLAALTVATGVPLSRTLAGAALAALGYVMLPVAPLDGVYVQRRVPNLLVTVALAIGTCMFALKWV